MSREVQVRFCESRGMRFPPATLPVVMCWSRSQAEQALERLTDLLAGAARRSPWLFAHWRLGARPDGRAMGAG